MIEKKLQIFADYFQFYVQDESSEGIDGDSWGTLPNETGLALEESAFAVSTARNTDVPVSVVISDIQPNLDLSLWDQVVEFSIVVPSGTLVIAGCTDYFPEAERITVKKGCHQVRVLCASLDKLSEDGLDGEDHYRVEMWKAPSKPFQMLKKHTPGLTDMK